jgi:uncharacterized protein YjiS (DUF1127 family)
MRDLSQKRTLKMAHATAQQSRSTSIIASFRSLVSSLRSDLRRHRKFAQLHDELSSLSDRELCDIGISRSQVVEIAWEASRG